ncbi:UNVERIFIED_CONTAM: hypothetical protein GTU68_028838, partial [Idotea baltica]|nr:hypothetical protein [Idotea baltica]
LVAESAAIPAEARVEIQRRLQCARDDHGARILIAIESGSRAWGFPSPDSDYDARFVYVLPLASYVSLKQPRDVIEQPIDGLFDLNGWGLRKALNLMLKGNPVICEWIRSPILYAEEDGFRARLENILSSVDERPAAQHHHASLMKANYQRFIAGSEDVKLKKYFYSLRPAYALNWMWQNPKGKLPMRFEDLRAGVDEPPALKTLIDDLVLKKSETRELGTGPRIAALDTFIEGALEDADARNYGRQPQPGADLVNACETLFQTMAGLEQ